VTKRHEDMMFSSPPLSIGNSLLRSQIIIGNTCASFAIYDPSLILCIVQRYTSYTQNAPLADDDIGTIVIYEDVCTNLYICRPALGFEGINPETVRI
jgi:hypothetical protein